jgi:hypothetical protein
MPDASRHRSAWEDRFRTPTPEALVDQMGKQAGALFEHARARATELIGPETLGWRGVPWRWSFEYADGTGNAGTRAFLVPSPERPRLALALRVEALAQHSPRKLPRHARDGLANAVEVGGVRWAEWELMSRTQVDELLALASAAPVT